MYHGKEVVDKIVVDDKDYLDLKYISSSNCPMRSHPAQHGETFDWSANLIA